MPFFMSLKIKGQEKTFKELKNLPKDMDSAQKSALKSTGFYITKEIRKFMQKEGFGSWGELHPVERKYEKESDDFQGGNSPFIKDNQKKSDLTKFGAFSRYILFRNGTGLITGYAFSRRPKRFDRKLEKVVGRLEKGAKTRVTEDARRFFAGATDDFGDKIGVNFFPLRKDTKFLVLEPRRIGVPVFRKIKSRTPRIFARKFVKSLARKNKFADRQFLKGVSSSKENNFKELNL